MSLHTCPQSGLYHKPQHSLLADFILQLLVNPGCQPDWAEAVAVPSQHAQHPLG